MNNITLLRLAVVLATAVVTSVEMPVAGVTLTVTPAVTSNTYSGVVTLTLTGLVSGEQVNLQNWIDGNTNGVIDAGDLLMDGGKINDGEVMVIGGITNLSKPFDSNPAAGAITTTLNFAAPLTLENIVARHIYRLSSPSNNFTAVTATFLVTNAATAQRVSGIIYSNGVTPMPYASVVATPAAGGYAGAAVADANGRYSLNLNPGTFNLIATAPNYYFDFAQGVTVVLTNGASATNALTLARGTATISGYVYNEANSNKQEGVMLELDSGSLFTIAFTDTNGNYSEAVTPDFWQVKPIKERLARRAVVASQNGLQVNTTSGNVTNANIGLPKGNALYYGRITDGSNVPFSNIRLSAGDGTNNLFSALGYSDANGYYAVAVLGNTGPDWNCNANDSDNTILANYVLNNFNNTNIAVGQAIQQNFVALPVTAHISGRVLDNLGNAVSGVTLYADQFSGGNNYQSQNSSTDVLGDYSLGVASGAWSVYFSFGSEDLASQGLVDLFQPYAVTVPPTNITLNLTVYTNGTPLLSQPQRQSATQFGFNVVGSVGVGYLAQVSTSLARTNWTTFATFQLTSNNFPIVDTHATNSPRFYRVQKN